MVLARAFIIAAIAVGSSMACLPGLGLGGAAGGGGCCTPAQPACSSPCGGGSVAPAAAPAPVYAAAPLAPAPFAGYPTGPQVGGGYVPQSSFPQGGGSYPAQPVYNGPEQSVHAGGSYADAFGRVQGGQPLPQVQQPQQAQQQVQPLPLLGQPVAYEQGPQQHQQVVVAQHTPSQILSTTQVLTKVMPASAVLDEVVVQPSEASANNIVSSIIAGTQNGYGDEHTAPVSVSSASSSSSSSSSASAEHHQVRVPSASSSVEVSERVNPKHQVPVAVQVHTPQQPQRPRQQVKVQQHVVTVAPAPAPVQQHIATHAPIQQVPVHHQVTQVEDRIEASPSAAGTDSGSDYDQPAVNSEQATVNELLASLDATTEPSNLDFHQVTVEPNHLYNQHNQHNQDQQEHQDHQEQIISTQAGDDYDAAAPEPEEASQSLDEDRKDVPHAGPSQTFVSAGDSNENHHVEVENIPEESAPIIPQPAPIQPYHPSTEAPSQQYRQPVSPSSSSSSSFSKASEVHLQPIQPSVRVETTSARAVPAASVASASATVAPAPAPAPVVANSYQGSEENVVAATAATSGYTSAYTDAYPTSSAAPPPPPLPVANSFEYPVEVHEVVTPKIALQPTKTSEIIENITSNEDEVEAKETPFTGTKIDTNTHTNTNTVTETEPAHIAETVVETLPNLNEYGSKFAKVQGAGTKQVTEPIELSEAENPYRRFWIF